MWNEPSGAVCRVLFNYIKQPMLIFSSHRAPCLPQLHFKWDFNVTTPRSAHWFISYFPPCCYSPFARLVFLPSSPSAFDLVPGWCVMSCFSDLHLLVLNKPTYRGGKTSPTQLMCSNLMCGDTFRPLWGGRESCHLSTIGSRITLKY